MLRRVNDHVKLLAQSVLQARLYLVHAIDLVLGYLPHPDRLLVKFLALVISLVLLKA